MEHTGRQTRQALQGGGVVQITEQWRDTRSPQFGFACGSRGQRYQVDTFAQLTRYSQPDIATTDDQNTLATKSGRQSA
jgi:hypothetical protein